MSMDTLFIVGRVIFGLYFAVSGLNHFTKTKDMVGYAVSKKVPSPQLAIVGTGLLMLLGGLGIALNIQLQAACILILIFLIPTTFIMHAFWTERDAMARMMDTVNFSKNIALIAAVLMLLA